MNIVADTGTFRGFLVQARQVADDTTVLGSFSVTDSGSRLSDCDPASVGVT